jgi:hypothetical protein
MCSTAIKLVQNDGEPFSVYVQSIQDATKVLRVDESEEQIVQHIVEGLTSEQHARFIFQPRPSSFQHVEELIIADWNIAYVDQTRKGPEMQVRQVAGDNPEGGQETECLGNNHTKVYSNKGHVVCFYCKKRGHVQSNCFLRRQQQKKPVKKKQKSANMTRLGLP